MFYPFIKERFLANYDGLIELVKSKPVRIKVLKTGLYMMNVVIDYKSFVNKLESCKLQFESKKIDIEK